jgi:protein-S-isoprenylcysteine O-methyltransferase Ste14
LNDLLALFAIIVWPVIPLFWIPVHGLLRFFKRIGLCTYLMPAVFWPPLAYFIYINRAFFLAYRIDFFPAVRAAGLIVLICGAMLQLWTGRLLSLFGLMGLPEVSRKANGRLVTEGAFSFVRHPTYLSHTLIFAGVFLLTGAVAVGAVTLLDFAIVNSFIIPLEEKELLARFGEDYARYRRAVPRFFPSMRKK